MPVIESALPPRSKKVRANVASMRGLVDDLQAKVGQVKLQARA